MNEILIAIGIVVGLGLVLRVLHNKDQKRYLAEGYQHGYATAKKLGCEKAFRIAESLPDCSYRDGYTQGVAEVEDETQ